MGFDVFFNCCWRESVKPLQFYYQTLSISYVIHERQLLFYRRLFCSDNIVLTSQYFGWTVQRRFEMLGVSKFLIFKQNFTA